MVETEASRRKQGRKEHGAERELRRSRWDDGETERGPESGQQAGSADAETSDSKETHRVIIAGQRLVYPVAMGYPCGAWGRAPDPRTGA